MLEHMWCLMAKAHVNWPFVSIDHLKQGLILLSTVLIPVRTANSSPNTPLLWHILRTAHCFPLALSHRLAFPLLCEAASLGSGRLQLGFWLLTTAGALAQHGCRNRCGREVCMSLLPLSSPLSTDLSVLLCHSLGQWHCSPQTRQQSPTSPGHPWLPPALHKGQC